MDLSVFEFGPVDCPFQEYQDVNGVEPGQNVWVLRQTLLYGDDKAVCHCRFRHKGSTDWGKSSSPDMSMIMTPQHVHGVDGVTSCQCPPVCLSVCACLSVA